MSKFVPREFEPLSSLKELVYNGAEKFGDKPLYYYIENKEKKTYTYIDHKNTVNAFGTALFDLGLNGKTVSLCCDQHPYWISSFISVIAVVPPQAANLYVIFCGRF